MTWKSRGEENLSRAFEWCKVNQNGKKLKTIFPKKNLAAKSSIFNLLPYWLTLHHIKCSR